jgi:nucleoside-diphosphate-sugar epimerase
LKAKNKIGTMNLITGATGLVGAHVALQLLQQNKTVVATKRSSSDILKTKKLFSYYTSDFDILFKKIKWVDANLNDIYSLIDALDGVETVYHCAGFVSFNSNDQQQLETINTIGTANLVNACLEKKNIAFCYVSSIATLQNPDIKKNITEQVYWKSSPTASNYAISKYNGEREVWRGIEEGLNGVIVNPGIILGPGFWNQSSGKLISNGYNAYPFYTDGGSATVDVNDVARGMIELINQNHFGKRFIMIENNYSFKEILTHIHNAFGKKGPTIKAGKPLLLIAKYLTLVSSFFTKNAIAITAETIAASLDTNTYSNNQIKEAISFKFTPIKDTLKFVCLSYQNDLKTIN